MSSAPGTAAPGGGGRPRDRQIDRAVLDAASELLDSGGFAQLTLEKVARRAGTTRPAIYRRWAGRAPLALAAVAARLSVPEAPDTGCTLCDLGESLGVFLGAYRATRPDVLAALYAECAPDPALRKRYLAVVVEPSRRAVAATLAHAASRGDLREDVDQDQVVDLFASLVQYRALFGDTHLSDEEAENVIELVLRGLAVDYDALLARSAALELEHRGGPGAPHVHLPD
ncbi:transcriptional regulator [Cellulosimicrobium funkei]|uniref:Transcriptional regulator n=1 Tax=Cellulosimicrobium funkei TaxID=264251 RepID=A0A0H2KN70_9MICO|nr:TetR/AcrR family transcriptional regulator [Cellulosimicrobium funkei]KLN33324.1 transcriptional regulator [Cellulosimicrobium funkei]